MTCQGFDAVIGDITIKLETYADHHSITFDEAFAGIMHVNQFSERIRSVCRKYDKTPGECLVRIRIMHESWMDD